MCKKNFKTTTLTAVMAVSKNETGMKFVQVMPDNPCVGTVTPFRGIGYGQLLSDGTFNFVKNKRSRRKPLLKLKHSSVSIGEDGLDRFIFVLPSDQRDEFCRLLSEEAGEVARFAPELLNA